MTQGAQQFDGDTILKASAAVTADARGTSINLGAAVLIQAEAVIDVTAMDTASGDEAYDLIIQGSSDDFSADIQEIGRIRLGDKDALGGGQTIDRKTGRWIVPFTNQIPDAAGVLQSPFKYIAIYTDVTGTTTSITYSAYMTKPRNLA